MPFAYSLPGIWQRLGIPSTKIPIDTATFVLYVLPPVVCYFVAAVLAVTPKTRIVRAALLPVVAWSTLRTAVSVDLSHGNPEQEFHNTCLILLMHLIATRTLEWSSAKGPLVRHVRPANSSPSIIMDALDLAANLRGHGWEWSRGLHIPAQTRPTDRIGFVFYTFLSVIAHTLVCSILHSAIVTLSPIVVGSTPGETSIFDETLPLFVGYLRASIITILMTLRIYAVLHLEYDLLSLVGILLLGQDPVQWPPAFNAPWRATSLSDFWSRRWHQWYRRMFIFLGGHPLSLVFGHTGMIIGAFLASAIIHQLVIVTLTNGVEVWRMLIGFGMMAPGVLAERAFRRVTGKKVGGVLGWIWTMTWLLVWGNVIIEAFARAGMFACVTFADSAFPVRGAVEPWVVDFDAWLHAIWQD